jgi:hypothetical protein
MKRINTRVELKRGEVRKLINEIEKSRAELHFLYLRHAQGQCPFEIGATVEYAPGLVGQVERIGYFGDNNKEIALDSDVNWTVSGHKIGRNGEVLGSKFEPVGPATHDLVGNVFRKRSK